MKTVEKELQEILEFATGAAVDQLKKFSDNLSNSPGIGEIATDAEIKAIQDLLKDLGAVVKKSASVKHMAYLHLILFDMISILMISPISLKGLSRTTAAYTQPIIQEKAIKNYENIPKDMLEKMPEGLQKMVKEFEGYLKEKRPEELKEECGLNLFDKDGKRMTIEDVMNL